MFHRRDGLEQREGKTIHIRAWLKGVGKVLANAGINPLLIYAGIKGVPRYLVNLSSYRWKMRRNVEHGPHRVSMVLRPMLADRYSEAGTVDGHYFFQDLWAAKKIFTRRPSFHVDVGSRLDGFVAHLLVFMDVEVFDIRTISPSIESLRYRQVNIMDTDSVPKDYCDSLSCLHALEHFGLGRYGDPIDPEGHIKGIDSLSRMLKRGGILYLSVPIGSERIEFDAHRVFDALTIRDLAQARGLQVQSFSYINDAGKIILDAEISSSLDLHYGCGLFEFQKVTNG